MTVLTEQAIKGVASFFKGEDDCVGVCVEGLADHEPVEVTLNAGMVRAVLKAAEEL